MAEITEAEIRTLAQGMSRLELSDAEVAGLASDMGSILEHLAALEEVDVDGVEIYVAATAGPLRPDHQETRLDQEEVFAQAPRRRDREFVVPKAIS